MPKKDSLHPKYRTIKVIMTNGDEFYTRSTYKDDVLKLDIDPSTHRAWTKGNNINRKIGQAEKYSKKFGNINVFDTVKEN